MRVETKEKLQGIVRLQISLAKLEGFKIDKKLMRYDDLVDLALLYGSMGNQFNPTIAEQAMYSEIVGMCVIGSTDYTGETPNYGWMKTCE